MNDPLSVHIVKKIQHSIFDDKKVNLRQNQLQLCVGDVGASLFVPDWHQRGMVVSKVEEPQLSNRFNLIMQGFSMGEYLE